MLTIKNDTYPPSTPACECHPLLDVDNFMEMYSLAWLLLRRIPAHPIGMVTSGQPCSLLVCRPTEKKYHQRSK
jgi:hypothetical protein